MRSTWTDSRLDDLSGRLDRMSGRIDRIADQVGHQSDRSDSLQNTILLGGGGLFAAVIGLIAAMLGVLVTQF